MSFWSFYTTITAPQFAEFEEDQEKLDVMDREEESKEEVVDAEGKGNSAKI